MFENLSERLERSFKILKGEGKITEINVAETLKDVRRALLDADVNYKVATLLAQLGVPTDPQGRVEVLPNLSLPGHPAVFAIGDNARVKPPRSHRLQPIPAI